MSLFCVRMFVAIRNVTIWRFHIDFVSNQARVVSKKIHDTIHSQIFPAPAPPKIKIILDQLTIFLVEA